MAKLRIIIDSPKSAAFNMSADLYLYNRCKYRDDELYLRIYRWKQPTLTLGYMQQRDSICDDSILKKDNVTLIRRATGGRTVLHWDDITYSFIFSLKNNSLGNSINETYGIISKALSRSLIELGVESEKHKSHESAIDLRSGIKNPCFLSPNRNEIMIAGRKLVGSAQKRGDKSVLQHGSIPLNKNFRKVTDYLSISEEHKSIILKELDIKAVSLEEVIKLPQISVIEDALVNGFKGSLGFEYYLKKWSSQEYEEIDEIGLSHNFRKKWLYE